MCLRTIEWKGEPMYNGIDMEKHERLPCIRRGWKLFIDLPKYNELASMFQGGVYEYNQWYQASRKYADDSLIGYEMGFHAYFDKHGAEDHKQCLVISGDHVILPVLLMGIKAIGRDRTGLCQVADWMLIEDPKEANLCA